MSEINPEVKIKVKARMSGTVIRGGSGEYGPPGSTEQLEFTGGSAEQVVELTHDQAVSLFGQEQADELFNGVEKGGDFSE